MKYICTAIVLSAGKGKRMNTETPKQYLQLCGKPVLYYSLKAFQDSFIDRIIVVASPADVSYVQTDIIERYGITKATDVVLGGKERYHSVLNGLRAAWDCDYIFIHDGARPFIDMEILNRAYATVKEYGTAIVSVPVKDTIKIVDDNGVAVETPDRSHVWQMQTPQVFRFKDILIAYEEMIDMEKRLLRDGMKITDDAMVMEHFGTLPVHISEGSYKNIKITTPEDMKIAEALMTNPREIIA